MLRCERERTGGRDKVGQSAQGCETPSRALPRDGHGHWRGGVWGRSGAKTTPRALAPNGRTGYNN